MKLRVLLLLTAQVSAAIMSLKKGTRKQYLNTRRSIMDQQSNGSNQDNSIRRKALDEIFCGSCGEIIKIKAEICPKCGVRQKGHQLSKAALLLLAFFLGGIGAHKFYIGKNWQGFFYIVFCWTGIPGLIALIEFIIYAFTSSEKLQEKYSCSGGGVVIAVIAGGIGFIFVVGILAAIAIPQYVAYRDRSFQATIYMKHRCNPAGKANRAYLFRVRQNSLCQCNFLYT
jgi:TM2 domain-containing membrane protein YozV